MKEQSPKGVTSCLGNVTATREGEQMGQRGSEIPSYRQRDGGWDCVPAKLPSGCCVCSGLS